MSKLWSIVKVVVRVVAKYVWIFLWWEMPVIGFLGLYITAWFLWRLSWGM